MAKLNHLDDLPLVRGSQMDTSDRTITIITETGENLSVQLVFDGERQSSLLIIDGRFYHFERIYVDDFVKSYIVDSDPNYCQATDSDGYCYMIAPFTKGK